jgi:hypothetical protein
MNSIKEFVHPYLGIRLDAKFVSCAVILLILGISLAVYSFNQQSVVGDMPVLLLGVGVILLIQAVLLYLFKGRALYFLPTEAKVEYITLNFDVDQLSLLKELCEAGKISTKSQLVPKDIGNVRLDILKSSDNCFAAVQVYQYKELMYVAQSEVRILNVAEVEDLLKTIKM